MKTLKHYWLKLSLGLVCSFGLFGSLLASDEVKIWKSKITLPTYEIGPEDPNPVFFKEFNYYRNYPYTNQDVITRVKRDKEYTALYLENKYLRVLVIPELGSRTYSLFDKTNGKEVWYRQHVVKPAEVAMRGAWISGGNEYEFPAGVGNQHPTMCMSPVDYALRKNPDGSATILLGDIQKIRRMQWTVGVTLYPGKAYLEQEAILYNRTGTPHPYIWWANATVADTRDLRFVMPARSAYPCPGRIMSYPIHEGVDYSKSRNILHAQSMFMRGVRRDFMGAYHTESDYGVVHVADYHEVPGKKVWTWGWSGDGKMWIKILTDTDGQYDELQTGRFAGEWDLEFMDPQKIDHLYEYWYPVKDMGTFVFANRDLAVNLERLPAGKKITNSVRIAVNATSNISNAKVRLTAGGKEVYKKTADLGPESPFSEVFSLKTPVSSDVTWVLEVSKHGKELIRYDTSEPIDNNPNYAPTDKEGLTFNWSRPFSLSTDMMGKSAELFVLEGLHFERFYDDIIMARESYQKALKIDPGYSQALLHLGILDYKAGEYEEARDYLHHAYLRNPRDIWVNYYLGLTLTNLDQLEAAEDHLWVGLRKGRNVTANLFALGQLALVKHKFEDASKFFRQTLSYEPLNFRAAGLLALSLRKQGKYSEARKLIKEKLFLNPIDYLLNNELYSLGIETSNSGDIKAAEIILNRLFKRDVENCLEIQSEYGSLGFFDESIRVLKYYVSHASDPKEIYPLVYYYLSYYNALTSNAKEAKKYNTLAGKMDNAYVFPYRTETIKVLKRALKLNPKDARAHYYLGNLLFSKYRYEEGIEEWKTSVKLEDFAVARRNLGLGYWKVDGNLRRATKEYEHAIKLNPLDFRYYVTLSDLYTQLGRTDEAFRLLKNAPKEVEGDRRVRMRLATSYILHDEYDKAIRILDGSEFVVREDERDIHSVNVNAHLGKGWRFYKSGKYDEALKEFQLALVWPDNQDVGKPEWASQAKMNYLIGITYQAKGQKSKARKYWEMAARETVRPMTYMDLVSRGGPPPYSEASYYKAMALKALGKTGEALDLLNGLDSFASGISSKDRYILSNAHYLKGLALKGKGKFKEADKEFQSALRLVPDNLDARFAMLQK